MIKSVKKITNIFYTNIINCIHIFLSVFMINAIFGLQMIIDEEIQEGYNSKVDKRSMCRIIDRLVADGSIKSYKTQLRMGDKVKVVRNDR